MCPHTSRYLAHMLVAVFLPRFRLCVPCLPLSTPTLFCMLPFCDGTFLQRLRLCTPDCLHLAPMRLNSLGVLFWHIPSELSCMPPRHLALMLYYTMRKLTFASFGVYAGLIHILTFCLVALIVNKCYEQARTAHNDRKCQRKAQPGSRQEPKQES